MHVSQFSGLAIFCLLRGGVAAAVKPGAPDFSSSRYHWSPKTTISYPGSQIFHDATERWDIYTPPTYGVAISPGTEADVLTAVTFPRFRNPLTWSSN